MGIYFIGEDICERVKEMLNVTNILIYQTEEGNTKIDVRLENGTVWMTQKAIVELYQTTKQNISLHIRNIVEEEELGEDSVVKFYLTTAQDGKSYNTLQSRNDYRSWIPYSFS